MMCPPSPSNHPGGSNSIMFLLDAERKEIQQSHKLTTADLCQVCDGRNWESFRDVSNKRNDIRTAAKTFIESRVTDEADIGAGTPDGNAADETTSHVVACPTPVSSLSIGTPSPQQNNQAKEGNGEKSQRTTTNPPEEVVVTAAKEEEDNGEKSWGTIPTPPEEVSATTEKEEQDNLASSPVSASSSYRRRSSTHSIRHRDQSEDPPELEFLATAKEEDDREEKSGRTIPTPPEEAPATTEKEEQDNPASRPLSKSMNQGRRASSNDLHHNDEPEDKVRGKDSTGRRRSSNEGKGRRRPRGKLSRRLSVGSDLVSVRNLSEPMHRCNTTNLNVSGIMRPGRYSSNNLAPSNSLAFMPRIDSEATMGHGESHGVRRSDSTSSNESESFDLGLSWDLDPAATRSSFSEGLACFGGSGSNGPGEHIGTMPDESNHWVASGVNFSKDMEVYLFQT